jgi:hypothetical protein
MQNSEVEYQDPLSLPEAVAMQQFLGCLFCVRFDSQPGVRAFYPTFVP